MRIGRRRVLAGACLVLPGAAAAAGASIDNFAFVPSTLSVAAGTTVIWSNRDDIPHTVTSAAHPPLFRSPPLDTGDAFSRIFDTPGTFGYFCALHPHMQGTVIVT